MISFGSLIDNVDRLKVESGGRRMTIRYRADASVSVEQAIDLYKRSTLGERRPINRLDTFAAMLKNANLIVTAWHGERLVGIARTLTDFDYVAYVADLAVDSAFHKQGTGTHLLQETRNRLGSDCMIVLIAAPKANDYYLRIGFEHAPRAWILRAGQSLRI